MIVLIISDCANDGSDASIANETSNVFNDIRDDDDDDGDDDGDDDDDDDDDGLLSTVATNPFIWIRFLLIEVVVP